MSAISEFRKSKEYKAYTDLKKKAFEKYALNLAQSKSPRVTDIKVLDENDIKTVKGKIKNIE